MGKSSSAIVGYHYRVLYHSGLGRTFDAFLEFRGGDRSAWTGELRVSGTIQINAPNLFGGERDQGGIVSDVDIMFGEADQEPSAYLLSNLGPQVPAWRGFTTLAFKGGRYGAMNPYPQKASYKIRKIQQGWDQDCWYPEKSEIMMTAPPSAALYFALDLSGSMDDLGSNGISRLENMKVAMHAVLDQIGEAIARGSAIDCMMVGFGSYPDSRVSILRRNMNAAAVAALHAWITSRSTAFNTYFTAGVMDMPDFYAGAADGADRVAFFVTDGAPFASGSSMTAEEIALEASAIVNGVPGVMCYGINIDLEDTTYTAMMDNTGTDVIPVVDSGDPAAMVAIIRSAIFGGVIGMNPAHILGYVRTDSEKGREPWDNINEASLTAAADRLFAEGFGLCCEYNPSSTTPRDFEERICRVIGGSFSRSLTDGQYYLDLARGDYVVGELPVLTDDDILEFREIPSTLDGAVNSVSVQYFDPDLKAEMVTPAVRALALVRRFGENHLRLEFPEIPTGSLALRVADRELRARITPTRAFELTTTRATYDWRPNQYFRLQSTKRGIADMVCIVGEKQSGTLRSGAIRLKAVQDIYSLPETTYVEVERGVDTAPSQVPVAIEAQAAFEAPYVEIVAALSRADFAALPPEIGYLLTVAVDPARSLNYAVAVDASAGYEEVGTGDWCPSALVAEAASPTDVNFTLTGGTGLASVATGTPAMWGTELCRVDSDPATGVVTLGRGCGDTIPQAHEAGERIWFFGGAFGEAIAEYTAGESVSVKLLTMTGSRKLALSRATPIELEFDERIDRPYPPGNFLISGDSFPSEIAFPATFTWSHRDRVAQADLLIDHTDTGPAAIEPGAQYHLQISKSTGGGYSVVESTATTGTSYTSTGDYADATGVKVELWTERDGLRSWQSYVLEFGEPEVYDPFWEHVALSVDMTQPNGNTFTDLSDYGNVLTAAGDVTTTGGETVFDGNGDFIWAPDGAHWNIGAEWCLEAWGVRFTVGSARTIMSHYDSYSPFANNRGWLLQISATGTLVVGISTAGTSGSTASFASTAALTSGTYDIRVERHDTGSGLAIRFYVNGALFGTAVSSTTIPFDSNSYLAIGAQNARGSTTDRNYFASGMKWARITLVPRNPGAASYVVPSLPPLGGPP